MQTAGQAMWVEGVKMHDLRLPKIIHLKIEEKERKRKRIRLWGEFEANLEEFIAFGILTADQLMCFSYVK
jgi:hypothetical protein